MFVLAAGMAGSLAAGVAGSTPAGHRTLIVAQPVGDAMQCGQSLHASPSPHA